MNTQLLNKKILDIMVGAVLILFSGNALQTMSSYTTYVALFAALIAFPFVAFEIMSKKINAMRLAFIVFSLMLMLTAIKELGTAFLTYLLIGAIMLVAYRITRSYTFEEFANSFLRVMTFVTFVSLICYTLLNTTDIMELLPRVTNVNDVEYGIGVIFNYIVAVPERNCGMFWEPGIFATFLSIALVIEIAFNKGKISKFRLVVYAAGIITANSTAGFILLLLCAILLLIKNRSDHLLYYISVGFVVLLLVLSPFIIYNLDAIISGSFLADNEYIQKLLSENLKEQTRLSAFAENIRVFLDNPFFGNGIAPTEEQSNLVSDTSTSTYLLSAFGILGIFYTVFLLYGIVRQNKLNTLSKIILVVIVLFIINKEPHQQIMFTWCFIFYLLKNDELCLNDERRDGNAQVETA